MFTLADGTLISSSYQYAYLIADYFGAILRIISGQSWIPGISEDAIFENARIMFRHAARVLDGQSEVIGHRVTETCTDCGYESITEYRGIVPGQRQVFTLEPCMCPSEQR